MTELWAHIPGTAFYEASDQGRIRSLRHPDRPVILATYKPSKRLYFQVGIHQRTKKIHTLVMLAFVGERPEGMEVRHLNGDATDNRLVNLAYGTPSENLYDRVRHGTHHNANKTACKHGHPFIPENTRIMASGSRRCLTCVKIWNRELVARRRALRLQETA